MNILKRAVEAIKRDLRNASDGYIEMYAYN